MAKKKWIGWAAVATTLVLLGTTALSGGLGASQAEAQGEGLELAVYNQDLALVKDPRSLDLSAGLNEVRFGDVAAQIDPTSVHFRSLTDPEGTMVLEQNYEYDIVGSAKMLQQVRGPGDWRGDRGWARVLGHASQRRTTTSSCKTPTDR